MTCAAPSIENGTRPVFVLIHGTWPRKSRQPDAKCRAAWCEETSSCSRALQSEFGADTEIHVFEWRGANSPGVRLAAADALNEFLYELRREHPDNPLFVIAHSHAGNVVLYAARKSRDRSTLDGVVFLSTPFLHVKPRTLGSRLANKLEFTASLVFVGLLFVTSVLVSSSGDWSALLHFQSYMRHDNLPIILTIGGSLLACSLVIPGLRSMHRWNHAYAHKLRLPARLSCPVLIIRSTADEAAGLLDGCQLLSHQATRLLRAGLRMVPSDLPRPASGPMPGLLTRWLRLPNYHKSGLAICASVGIPLAAALLLNAVGLHLNRHVGELVGIVAVLGVLFGMLLMAWDAVPQMMAIPLFLVCNTLAAIVSIPFGGRFALATLSMDVSSEPMPPGRWTCLQLPPSTVPYENRHGLSHATHSDPAALREMTRWLREIVDQRDLRRPAEQEARRRERT